MTFFDRLKNGWKIGWIGLNTIRENPSLLLFMIMAGGAMVLVLISFFSIFLIAPGYVDYYPAWSENDSGNAMIFVGIFMFYLIGYFIMVFFNLGLVYCVRQVFDGEAVSIREGLEFSISRINVILPWAVLAATVGMVLRLLQERLGFLGQLVTGLIGMVWSISTFFVIPILAFDDVGALDALKRSMKSMKEHWGEAVGANFTFLAFYLLGYLFAISYMIFLFGLDLPKMALGGGLVIIVLSHTAISAAKTVFVTASYQHLQNESTGKFAEPSVLDQLFVPK